MEKKCHPTKILNPFTKRCINKPIKCISDKIFNPLTKRCVKKQKFVKFKECPSGKKLNPLTNRCVIFNERNKKNLEIARFYSKQHYFIDDFINDNKQGKVFNETTTVLNKHLISLIKFQKAKIVQRFMKNNLLIKRFDLDSRIKFYKYIKSFIINVDDESCLKPKIFIWKNNKQTNGFTINDIIDLEKQIGSDSKNAIVYKTSIKNMIGSAPIATKLMIENYDNYQEIMINEIVTKKLVLNKESRHFLLTYDILNCFSNETLQPSLPKLIQKKNYYITLNELAHGDLKYLVNTKHLLSEYEMSNLFVQIMLSIATFHCIGFVHRDCHWGNFLYHDTKNKSGVYFYKINNNNVYVKNCKYNVMIYDFGYAKNHIAYKKYNPTKEDLEILIDDYIKISWAFKNTKWGGIGVHKDYPSDNISQKVSNITNHLNRYLRYNYKLNNKKEDYSLNSFITLLQTLLINEFPQIISITLSQGEKIINNHPYLIDYTLKKRMKANS